MTNTQPQAAQVLPTERQLYELCQAFIKEQRIHCAETIYQSDRVIENAYVFIEQVCDLVGYLESEDDDE